ncbi:MAG: ester cyclase [Phenylobacterium sp.]|uniref:ester cyclase n=1 Tax=Phenylobacterium sp. TaxID=1871053 RepID=UPI00391A78EA
MNLAIVRRNEAAVRRFLAGTHGGDLSVIEQTVSPTIVTHGFPGGADPDSLDSYRAFFETFGLAFSNMAFEVHSLVADERLVAVRFGVAVDHTGPFAGAPPTGRRVSFEGMALYRMADGLIAETWLQLDELALLTQVGLMQAA